MQAFIISHHSKGCGLSDAIADYADRPGVSSALAAETADPQGSRESTGMISRESTGMIPLRFATGTGVP